MISLTGHERELHECELHERELHECGCGVCRRKVSGSDSDGSCARV